MKLFPSFILLMSVSAPALAQLSDLSLGLGGSLETSAYKMRYRDYSVLPLLNYDDDTWYLEGAEAGYYLINDDVNELKIKTYYDFTSYNSNLGHGDAMRSLKDRHGSLMTGFSYQYTSAYGALHTQIAVDTLGRSKGLTGEVSYLNMFNFNALSLIPEIGGAWANAQQNRYYYGISQHESHRSGLRAYHPHGSLTPFVSLTINYALNNKWNFYTKLRSDFLPSELRDSPMVGHDGIYSYSLGVIYDF